MIGEASGVQHFAVGQPVCSPTPATVDARLVVDATGLPAALLSRRRPDRGRRQTAYGVVVAEHATLAVRPTTVTLMDLRPVAGDRPAPTFCYVVPVADGWLVEETVLAGPADGRADHPA